MTFDDEEQRAAAWRRQQQARLEFRRGRRAALAGDAGARTEISRRWAGFIAWMIERKEAEADE